MYTINELIENSGLKGKYIAEKVGVSPITVTNWRKGHTRPKREDLKRLANVLNVDINIITEQ